MTSFGDGGGRAAPLLIWRQIADFVTGKRTWRALRTAPNLHTPLACRRRWFNWDGLAAELAPTCGGGGSFDRVWGVDVRGIGVVRRRV